MKPRTPLSSRLILGFIACTLALTNLDQSWAQDPDELLEPDAA